MKKKYYTLEEVKNLYIGEEGSFEREQFEQDLLEDSTPDREARNWRIFNDAAEKYADLTALKQLHKRREECYRQGITPDEYISMWEESLEIEPITIVRELLLTC